MGWKRTTQLCQCIIILLFIIWQYVVFNISWNNELDPLKFPPSYVDRFYIFLIMITNFITWIFIAELIETHFYLVTIIEIENAHFEADCIWLSFRSNHQLLFFGMLMNHPFPKSFFFLVSTTQIHGPVLKVLHEVLISNLGDHQCDSKGSNSRHTLLALWIGLKIRLWFNSLEEAFVGGSSLPNISGGVDTDDLTPQPFSFSNVYI